jgi:hypothetical protein
MRIMASRVAVAAAALLVVSVAGPTRAETIDQEYLPVTGQGYNTGVSSNLPIGQEFTPTLDALDFVDLFIGDAGSDAGPGASFEVNIRGGSIGGTILGTSNVAFVADGTNTGVGLYADFVVTRFTFDAPVALTPGLVAVIEVVQLGPIMPSNGNFIVYGGPLSGSTYAGGRAIIDGAAVSGFDFAFREGINAAVIPEPSTLALCGPVVLMGLAGWRSIRRRAAG